MIVKLIHRSGPLVGAHFVDDYKATEDEILEGIEEGLVSWGLDHPAEVARVLLEEGLANIDGGYHVTAEED